jgi:hypothetical protein
MVEKSCSPWSAAISASSEASAPRRAGRSAPGRTGAPFAPATVSIIRRASLAIAFAVKSPPSVPRSPRTKVPFIPAMNASPVEPSISRVSSAELPQASPRASASRSPCALTASARFASSLPVAAFRPESTPRRRSGSAQGATSARTCSRSAASAVPT